jgi:hypothetical protein
MCGPGTYLLNKGNSETPCSHRKVAQANWLSSFVSDEEFKAFQKLNETNFSRTRRWDNYVIIRAAIKRKKRERLAELCRDI